MTTCISMMSFFYFTTYWVNFITMIWRIIAAFLFLTTVRKRPDETSWHTDIFLTTDLNFNNILCISMMSFFYFTTYWVNFITMIWRIDEFLLLFFFWQMSENDLMRLLDCLEHTVLRFLNFTDIFLTTAQIWQVFLNFSLIAILLIDEFLLLFFLFFWQVWSFVDSPIGGGALYHA